MTDQYVLGAVRWCQHPAFWRFLEKKLRFPVADKETAADGMRQLCDIKSRGELATNPRGRAAYKALIAEFNTFMKDGHA